MKIKILIIRFSSIGDIVLTSPVVRCLKMQMPECELHFVTKKAFLPVIAFNPYIDKIYTIEKSLSEIKADLKAEKYTYIIDLHRSIRSTLLTLWLLRPFYSFSKLNLRKFLLVKFKLNLLPGIHIVDRYFSAVKSLGIQNDNNGLDFFIPEDQEINPADFGERFSDAYHVLVIGAKHFTKQILAELACGVISGSALPVILAGGPEDSEKGNSIALRFPEKVYNACGKLTLIQSASLIKQASKIVTADTGLMHIAAALGKEIISVWGNTVPEFGMYPYMPRQSKLVHIAEVKGLSCRPCSKLGYTACPEKHFNCMQKQDLQQILDWLNKNSSLAEL